jgi:hypothetical protein
MSQHTWNLPPELILEIVSWCEPQTIVSLRRVSSLQRELFKDVDFQKVEKFD